MHLAKKLPEKKKSAYHINRHELEDEPRCCIARFQRLEDKRDDEIWAWADQFISQDAIEEPKQVH